MMMKTKGFLTAVLGAFALTLLAGVTPVQAQVKAAAAPEYRLGAGDVVHISVYQNPDLSLDARVSEAGIISYPLLGNVKIGGLPATQAERVIADGLRKGNFIKQPQVSVMVTQARGHQASVLGHVNRPGRYVLENADTRLTDLIATAGGVAANGADIVTVVGVRDGTPFRQQVDLPALFRDPSREGDLIVRDGDAIYVDRQPLIYIYGEVQRPGEVRLERGMTLMQALAAGGGLTARGTEKGLRVHRRDGDGNVKIVTPAMNDAMQTGDVVYVRESLF